MTLFGDTRCRQTSFLVFAKDYFPLRLICVAVALITSSIAQGEDEERTDSPKESYYRQIGSVQTDLDAGRIDQASDSLAKTDERHRDFEFDYLQARLRAASEGASAPDLIRFIAKPDVESRYAIMNATNRDVVYICRDGSLHVHNLATPDADPRVVTYEEGGAIWTGNYSGDGKQFLAGHSNGEVVIRDASTWQVLHQVDLGSGRPVRELASNRDGSRFVAESPAGLELWEISDNGPTKTAVIVERFRFGEGLSISPLDGKIATGGMFDIRLHDGATGKEFRSMRHASYTMGLQFSPDGRFIASAPRGNVNKCLAIFDVSSQQMLFNVNGLGHYILGMAFTPSCNRIAATSCDKKLRLLDTATGQVAVEIERDECGSKIAFNRDGNLLGWSEQSGFYYIDLESEQ